MNWLPVRDKWDSSSKVKLFLLGWVQELRSIKKTMEDHSATDHLLNISLQCTLRSSLEVLSMWPHHQMVDGDHTVMPKLWNSLPR